MSDPNNPSPVNYADYSVPGERRTPMSVIVLSIIGLLWAAFAIICMPLFMVPFFMKIPPPANAVLDAMKNDPQVFMPMVVGTVVAVVLGLVLLAGSIGSLMLARFAWLTMLVYAMLSLVLGMINLVINIVMVMPRATIIAQQHGQPTSNIQAYFGYFIAFLAVVYQICILYFYSRPKVKQAFGK